MYGVPLPPRRTPTPPLPPKFEELPADTPSSSTPPSGASSSVDARATSSGSSYNRAPLPKPRKKQSSGESWFAPLWRNPLALAAERRYYWVVAGGLLLWEAMLCGLIIRKVRYTEIDFSTYLQQAELFMKGERDYSKIEGESGPCYYPAMHLYLYSLLHKLVKPVFGVDLATGVPGRILEGRMNLAQYAFAGVYVASLALVFVIYGRNKRLPQYLLPLLTISKRLHSIYVLRMFNDCLAMLFFYAAVVLYTSPEGGRLASALKGAGVGKRGRWAIGTGVFSLALGTKMSLLLPLPGLLYLLFVYHSPLTCLAHSLLLLTTQLALALPFSRPTPAALSALISSPSLWTLLPALAPLRTYLTQAFSLSRSFLYEFTQNWRWLQDEDLFLSRDFANLLLLAQAAGLCLFAVRWAEDEGGVESLLARAWRSPGKRPARREATPERIATILFTSNLVGVLCARSLHPQFYAWFAWQGVWVTFGSGIYEGMQNMLFLSLLEFAFHTYPSTVHSSLGFCIGLLAILAGVYYGRPCGEPKEEQRWEVGREAKGRKEE